MNYIHYQKWIYILCIVEFLTVKYCRIIFSISIWYFLSLKKRYNENKTKISAGNNLFIDDCVVDQSFSTQWKNIIIIMIDDMNKKWMLLLYDFPRYFIYPCFSMFLLKLFHNSFSHFLIANALVRTADPS